jgi:Zn-dependent protease with chaperone function
MPEFQARYFDGLRAVAHDARVSLDALGLTITRAEGQVDRWGRDEVAAKPGSENEPAFRVISSRAPGAQLVVEDAAAIRALTSTLASLQRAVPRRRRARYWVGLSAAALAVVAAIVVAVDRLPEWAAPLVPTEWEAWFGGQVIAGLARQEGGFCQGAAGQAALDDLARRLSAAADLGQPVTVRVINWKVVNAFAVPGAHVGILRGLIERAQSGDEVAGVLAHEVGHVAHRHPTVGLLRQMGLAATAVAARRLRHGVQDAAGFGQTPLTPPTAAGRGRGRRDVTILGKAGLDAHGLNRFFARLQKEGDIEASTPSLLLTHPPTAERLAATAQAPNGAPALTSEQWQALRRYASSRAEPTRFCCIAIGSAPQAGPERNNLSR